MPPSNGMTFAEAARQRADKRFKIEIEGMPALFARRVSARENRLLRQASLREGKTLENLDDEDALDNQAYSFALLAACCENEDGSAAFQGGEEQLMDFDEPLLGRLITEVTKVAIAAGDPGND